MVEQVTQDYTKANLSARERLIADFTVKVSRIFAYERLPDAIAGGTLNITDNKIFLMINLFMVIMGMIMDDLSAMLLAAPLLFSLFQELGVHPFQMAAIMTVNQGSGQMTPPVATNLFTAARVSGIPVSEFLGDRVPFLFFGSLPVLLLTTFVSEVSLFLPRLIMGG